MRTITEISIHFKNFADWLFENGSIREGFGDILTFFAIFAFLSIFANFAERSDF